MEKKYCVSVRYSSVSKPMFYYTDSNEYKEGDYVIVETIRGQEIGVIASPLTELKTYKGATTEMSPIIAKANETAIHLYNENIIRGKKALKIAEEECQSLGLEMNLLAAEYILDSSKVSISYTSENRVDFRELIKILATRLHCHIDLRQIGSRDKAKAVGGIGLCGLELCCSRFLNTFDGISINKAKNQMLSLNIPKLSGHCGKLICCLNYEDDAYSDAKKRFPHLGESLFIEGKQYRISSFNIMTDIVKCDAVDDIKFLPLEEVKKYLKNNRK